jgi:hypothetical protein
MKRIEELILADLATLRGPAAGRLGLRFDRVALRVTDDLRQLTAQAAPSNLAVLLTVTAPIKLPAKTVIGIANRLKPLLAARITRRNLRARICGNGVRLRLIKRPSKLAPAFVGFVHNPDSDPGRLLDLAAAWINSRPRDLRRAMKPAC